MKLLFLATAFALSYTSLRAEEPKKAEEAKPAAAPSNVPVVIDSTKAEAFAGHLGKTVTVKGAVARTTAWDGGLQKKKKMNFIDFKWGHFGTVTFEDDFAAFGQHPPATAYKGKTLEVTGELQERQGKFQIILKTPDQVKVVDDEPKPEETKGKPKGKDAKKPAAEDEKDKTPAAEDASKDADPKDKKRVDPKKYFKP